jgi:hypothetical protein
MAITTITTIDELQAAYDANDNVVEDLIVEGADGYRYIVYQDEYDTLKVANADAPEETWDVRDTDTIYGPPIMGVWDEIKPVTMVAA